MYNFTFLNEVNNANEEVNTIRQQANCATN